MCRWVFKEIPKWSPEQWKRHPAIGELLARPFVFEQWVYSHDRPKWIIAESYDEYVQILFVWQMREDMSIHAEFPEPYIAPCLADWVRPLRSLPPTAKVTYVQKKRKTVRVVEYGESEQNPKSKNHGDHHHTGSWGLLRNEGPEVKGKNEKEKQLTSAQNETTESKEKSETEKQLASAADTVTDNKGKGETEDKSDSAEKKNGSEPEKKLASVGNEVTENKGKTEMENQLNPANSEVTDNKRKREAGEESDPAEAKKRKTEIETELEPAASQATDNKRKREAEEDSDPAAKKRRTEMEIASVTKEQTMVEIVNPVKSRKKRKAVEDAPRPVLDRPRREIKRPKRYGEA